MVSDNAAYFTSQEFESYLELNAIRHAKLSPYHPSSNGLVERAVQSLKNGLKKVKEGTLEARIAKILFQYRITPHSTTGIAPAELLLRARPRSRMYALFPKTAVRVQAKQEQQKSTHDTTARNRSFSVGQSVLVRNFAAGERRIPGHIIEPVGPVLFMIELEDGHIFKRHQNHIRNRLTSQVSTDIPNISSDFMDFPCPAAESQQSSSNTQ